MEFRKHWSNLMVIAIGLFMQFLALWQLDWQVARWEWEHQYLRELLPFWYMWNTWAYVMWFGILMAVPFVLIVALWYWNE